MRHPGAGLAGLRERRVGGVVEQERLLAELERTARRRLTFDAQHPGQVAVAAHQTPVAFDRDTRHDQHVAGGRPLVDGIAQPVEVLLPELLALPAVVVDGGGRQGDRGLVGRAVAGRRIRHLGRQRQVHRAGFPHREVESQVPGGRARDAGLVGAGEQPVAQAQRGEAVVLVVVGDGVELGLGGIRLPGPEQVSGVGVLGDRVGGIVDALTVLVAHVERFELLDRIAARAHPQALLDHGVEVHEHVVAEQVVDGVFAHTVPGGQREQVGALVRGVVVDVQVGVPGALRGHVSQEVDQGLPFLGVVVRPERTEGAVGLDQAEEVVQAPLRAVGAGGGLAVERVALEVEEDVAGVGLGQGAERHRVVDLESGGVGVAGLPGGKLAGLQLQPGLGADGLHRGVDQPVDRAGAGGEGLDGVQSGLQQVPALGEPHAGDEQHVAVRLDLHGARRAAPAGGVARVAPPGGLRVGEPFVDQAFEPGAALAIDGQDVAEPMRARASVAEQQVHLLAGADAEPVELVAVRGHLQQGGDLRRAGQLGVVDLVGAVLGAHDEVGEPDEAAVEEGGLEEHIGPGAELLGRRGCRRRQVPHRRAGELDHIAAQPQPFEIAQLVLVAESAGPAQHGVALVGHGLDAAEFAVELLHHGPLAARGCAEVARTEDDGRLCGRIFGRIEQEHEGASTCWDVVRLPEATDTGPLPEGRAAVYA